MLLTRSLALIRIEGFWLNHCASTATQETSILEVSIESPTLLLTIRLAYELRRRMWFVGLRLETVKLRAYSVRVLAWIVDTDGVRTMSPYNRIIDKGGTEHVFSDSFSDCSPPLFSSQL